MAPRIAASTQFATIPPERAAIALANETASAVPAIATGSLKYVCTPVRYENIVAPQIRISEMAAVRTTERIASPTLYPRYRRPTADHKTEICVWRTTIENARLASS